MIFRNFCHFLRYRDIPDPDRRHRHARSQPRDEPTYPFQSHIFGEIFARDGTLNHGKRSFRRLISKPNMLRCLHLTGRRLRAYFTRRV